MKREVKGGRQSGMDKLLIILIKRNGYITIQLFLLSFLFIIISFAKYSKSNYEENKRNIKKFSKYSNESFATQLVIGEKNIINALLNFTQTALGVLLLNNRVLNRHLKNNINGYILTLQTMQ